MKRQYFILLVTLIGFLGSATSYYALATQRDYELRGYTDASRNYNLPYRVPRLGVNVELTRYKQSELEQQLELMEAAHIYWIRQPVQWREIEPEKGVFEWEAWDIVFNTIAQHPNLHVIAVITTSPSWARIPSGKSETAPPADPETIKPFLNAFTTRYGNIVNYYQIWDEPNLQIGWGGTDPHPTSYVALLAEGYKAIHSSDPEATVIAAALAPTVETKGQNISDWLYLRDMYAVGAKDFMDGVAAKPYGFNTSALDRDVNQDKLNFSRVILLREEMIQQGDEKKAIWVSNWGWNRDLDQSDNKVSIWGGVSEAQRVEYSLAALDRVEREWPWVAAMTLQHWQPNVELSDPEWGFALINPDNTPTDLYIALSNRQQDKTAQNGLFSATTPFAHYSGVWTFGPLGADIGWVQDSHFEFSFGGSDVSLLLRKGDYTANLYPTIDEEPANVLPRDDSGHAYIVLTSASLEPETNLIPVARNLLPGKHVLKVVADKGWDRWAIVGFGVSAGNLLIPYDRQLLVAGFAFVLSFFGLVLSGRAFEWPLVTKLLRVIQLRISTPFQLLAGSLASLALLIGMMITWGDGVPSIFRREPVPLVLSFATLGIIKLQPSIIIVVFALIVLFIIIYNNIYLGLVLTMFWCPFFLFPVELYRFAFPMSEVVILVTGVAWITRIVIFTARRISVQTNDRRQPIEITHHSILPIDYAVILWGVIGIISLVWSHYQQKAVTELRVMILEPLLFYVIFRASRLNRRQIETIISAFLLAGIFVALIGLWQYFRGEAIITAESGAQRLASVYGSPNNVALYLGRCIPFLLANLLNYRTGPSRVINFLALMIMTVAVLLTQSVGAIFIGIPVSVIAVVVFTMKRHIKIILAFSFVILVVAFLISTQFPRFARARDFSNGTNFYRLRVWESAINAIRENPFSGLGLDQFLYEFRSRYILPDAWQEPNLSHPHNILLDFWVRLGLTGVLLLIWIQVLFWKNAVRLHKYFHIGFNLPSYVIVVGSIGSMVNLLSHGLVDNSVYVQDLSYVFVMLLAIVASMTTTVDTSLPVPVVSPELESYSL